MARVYVYVIPKLRSLKTKLDKGSLSLSHLPTLCYYHCFNSTMRSRALTLKFSSINLPWSRVTYIQQSTMSIVNNYFRWLQWNIPSHSAPALEGERSESSKTFPYQIRNELPSNTKFRFFFWMILYFWNCIQILCYKVSLCNIIVF